MPRLYSSRQVIKALNKLGFSKISQKGSHIKIRGIIEGKLQTAIIPNHKQIAKGTLSSMFNPRVPRHLAVGELDLSETKSSRQRRDETRGYHRV